MINVQSELVKRGFVFIGDTDDVAKKNKMEMSTEMVQMIVNDYGMEQLDKLSWLADNHFEITKFKGAEELKLINGYIMFDFMQILEQKLEKIIHAYKDTQNKILH